MSVYQYIHNTRYTINEVHTLPNLVQMSAKTALPLLKSLSPKNYEAGAFDEYRMFWTIYEPDNIRIQRIYAVPYVQQPAQQIDLIYPRIYVCHSLERIDLIKQVNFDSGRTYFGEAEMRFFHSRTSSRVFSAPNYPNLFVVSKRFAYLPQYPRYYNVVALLPHGDTHTFDTDYNRARQAFRAIEKGTFGDE